MITWGEYLCRGVHTSGIEAKPVVDTSMYPKGVNAPFLNIEGKDPSALLSDYQGRFENKGRDIARAEHDIIELLKSHCGLKPGQKVVDFGSGTGLFLQSLSLAVLSHGSVIATEISSVFHAHLVRKVLADELMRSTVQVVYNQDGANPQLSGHAGTVDLIFVCDVYHHIEWPFSVMRHLRSALREKTGKLVLIDFHRDTKIHTSHPEDPDWILKHVRAGKDQFVAEICSCGFELELDLNPSFIPENYFCVFRPVELSSVGSGWALRK